MFVQSRCHCENGAMREKLSKSTVFSTVFKVSVRDCTVWGTTYRTQFKKFNQSIKTYNNAEIKHVRGRGKKKSFFYKKTLGPEGKEKGRMQDSRFCIWVGRNMWFFRNINLILDTDFHEECLYVRLVGSVRTESGSNETAHCKYSGQCTVQGRG